MDWLRLSISIGARSLSTCISSPHPSLSCSRLDPLFHCCSLPNTSLWHNRLDWDYVRTEHKEWCDWFCLVFDKSTMIRSARTSFSWRDGWVTEISCCYVSKLVSEMFPTHPSLGSHLRALVSEVGKALHLERHNGSCCQSTRPPYHTESCFQFLCVYWVRLWEVKKA